ncbi:alpha/beta hydrolase family protein [Cronobacter dublinensis]|uniref:alpha/beta hydrolase family protein n=1 Tax=Cronobacter dublinensis TaxID=413497 RepID=UPI000CFA9789|nr:alpha/beta hydrolase [Cronobacter dublinensis]EKY3246045.1 alpha/beta hydrolase [Cronobacter dublinensis]MDT3607542.1 alpha/beta hydrolase [Cronobacter dublinensis]
MRFRLRKTVIIISVLILLVTLWVMSRLAIFDAQSLPQAHTVTFIHNGNPLQGTLTLPDSVQHPPVALLVHGDGAQDRWSQGGYLPLVNTLLANGIAVFSWDKPGVGESGGNWLAQTMRDRSDEAVQAMTTLRKIPALSHSRFGFLGFSQAGWVVPKAAALAHADFAVIVGGAINWRDQGSYFLETRLALSGHTPSEIAQAIQNDRLDFARRYTAPTVSRPCAGRCTRDDFERRNALADARADITQMKIPVMVLMGANDRNVRPGETLTVWAATLPPATPRCLRMMDGATHGLLKSRWYDYQLPSQWPWWAQALFLLSGEHAYAPGAPEAIATWIHTQQCAPY